MKMFKFEKECITDYIRYDLNLFNNIKEPINYIFKILENKGNSLTLKSLDKINLNKIKELKGKNYNWSVINYKNVKLLIRSYGKHLTIYTKITKNKNNKNILEYGAFTFYTNLDNFKGTDIEHDILLDEFYDNHFYDLNKCIKELFNVLIERGVYWVNNSVCFKVPEYVEIKLAYCDNIVSSYDNFIYCIEEIDFIYYQLFAETSTFKMLEIFKNKIDEQFNCNYKIKEVKNDLKDNYYHNVGILLVNDKNETKFEDVYSLTRWYFENIFNYKTYIYEGELYVEGDKFEIGKPVAYKDTDISDIILYSEVFKKDNFIPLKKI